MAITVLNYSEEMRFVYRIRVVMFREPQDAGVVSVITRAGCGITSP